LTDDGEEKASEQLTYFPVSTYCKKHFRGRKVEREKEKVESMTGEVFETTPDINRDEQ